MLKKILLVATATLRHRYTATLLALLCLTTAPLSATSVPPTFANIIVPLLPAVVNISTTTTLTRGRGGDGGQSYDFQKGSPLEDFFKDFMDQMHSEAEGPRNITSLGSGFIISPDGYIVTNYHVVADADQVTVILKDGVELKATLVGRDRRTDIAVLKVTTNKKLPFVQWGKSEKLRIGDWVIAIGNPFGLGGTVTAGIVSHLARDMGEHSPAGDFIGGYIQTDAAITLGNSGGPMFDMSGKVVGVNRAFFSPNGNNVGIGFSIPSEVSKKVVDQICQYGRAKRGWLGVHVQPVTGDIAEGLGLKQLQGALVATVIKGGPADKAKLQSADVILKVGAVEVKDERSLSRIVGDIVVASEVPILVWRKGKLITLLAQVGEYEEAEETGLIPSPDDGKELTKGVEIHGMTLQPLSPEICQRFDIENGTQGVLVVDVLQKSSASEKGVRPGDIIVEISQEEVKAPQDVMTQLKKAEKENRKSALLLLNRDGASRYISIRLQPDSGKS